MMRLGFVPANHSKEALHCETIKTKSKSSKALFGRAVDMYEDFVLVSGFGKTDSQFVGSAFLYMKNTNENLEPIRVSEMEMQQNSLDIVCPLIANLLL